MEERTFRIIETATSQSTFWKAEELTNRHWVFVDGTVDFTSKDDCKNKLMDIINPKITVVETFTI